LGIQLDLDSRFHGNDTPLIIPHLMRDPEIADWIPVFTGMTKRRHENDRKVKQE